MISSWRRRRTAGLAFLRPDLESTCGRSRPSPYQERGCQLEVTNCDLKSRQSSQLDPCLRPIHKTSQGSTEVPAPTVVANLKSQFVISSWGGGGTVGSRGLSRPNQSGRVSPTPYPERGCQLEVITCDFKIRGRPRSPRLAAQELRAAGGRPRTTGPGRQDRAGPVHDGLSL